MGDLPPERVQPTRPFVTCGVDYAGPVLIKYKTANPNHSESQRPRNPDSRSLIGEPLTTFSEHDVTEIQINLSSLTTDPHQVAGQLEVTKSIRGRGDGSPG
ncbi:hypothetical protein ILUMI_03648 [Ignelater luminosus]|uniref:Uncharacterized protein n=1 Tax=Ignelater luminosus TaxID=2038154 RepID=A0A8K0GK97_IGNLU|nr:hypothetical protein ILUMI_03648 [Ignelater luminosus]